MSTHPLVPFFDLHVHASPDTYARRYTPLTLGEEMKASGGGVVIKSHLTATTSVARLAREQGLPVYGSITLNAYAGGISLPAVQAALAANGDDGAPMVIWFPTLTGHGCKPRIAQQKSHPVLDAFPVPQVRVSENGRLRPEVVDVIKLAAAFNLPLATGHASKEEVYLLVDEVVKQGGRIMLTHPCHPCTGLTPQEVADLMSTERVWAEVAVLMTKLGYESADDVLNLLEGTDLSRVCVSTDFGQRSNPTVTEGYAWFLNELRMAAEGRAFQPNDAIFEQICNANPRQFLGLEARVQELAAK
jgi:hypothetical protein